MPNIFELRAQKDIEAEASAWIVQLHGKKPTAEDLRALGEWMRRSPSHREALSRYAAVWDEANTLSSLLDEVAAADVARETEAQERKARRLSFGLPAFAAAAAALALLGFGIYSGLRPSAPASYETALGEQNAVELADGSQVLLNTDTQLRAEFSDAGRAVYLERGEALFTVRADPARPFYVHVGETTLRAVGTVFAVRFTDDAQVELTVSDGVVEVADSEGGPALQYVSANQSCTFSQDGPGALRLLDADSLARSLSWRDGVLMFKGETLEAVVAEVSRYTDEEFVFENPALRQVRIGGYFRVGEVDGLLVALEGSFGVEVRREGSRRIVLSGGDIN